MDSIISQEEIITRTTTETVIYMYRKKWVIPVTIPGGVKKVGHPIEWDGNRWLFERKTSIHVSKELKKLISPESLLQLRDPVTITGVTGRFRSARLMTWWLVQRGLTEDPVSV